MKLDAGRLFDKLDAGRLFDKYVGETEKNFRRAIDLAAAMAPAILWIDEIEKALAGGGGDDGGVSRRLLGSFLTWLQEHDEAVFVVATANDLTVLPPELLRKGRFDEVFFVDLPDDGERRSIFEIHLKLRKQSPVAFGLDDLVSATTGFSGAEIEQAAISALYRALATDRFVPVRYGPAGAASGHPMNPWSTMRCRVHATRLSGRGSAW